MILPMGMITATSVSAAPDGAVDCQFPIANFQFECPNGRSFQWEIEN
jgi:hypothetical protein